MARKKGGGTAEKASNKFLFMPPSAVKVGDPKKMFRTAEDFYCGIAGNLLLSFLWIWKL